MKIAVKLMKIESRTEPTYIDMSLHDFFITSAHDFEENELYPFTFPNDGETKWCSILEGGCQYSFDRDEKAPIRCIGCLSSDCTCKGGANRPSPERYALQRFTTTRIYVLDIDLNSGTLLRDYHGGFVKYHTLTYEEEQSLRDMEDRIKKLPNVLFFYRTKCNGFRIGFDAERELTSLDEYESLAIAAEEMVKECTPDRKLKCDNFAGGAWFHVDRIREVGGMSIRSQAYWCYPRVYHPVWLNPNRKIE